MTVRVASSFRFHHSISALFGSCSVSWLSSAVHAQPPAPARETATLFQNVRIFDGKSGALSAPSNVLVKGNIIERISTAPIAAKAGADGRSRAAGAR